MPDAYTLGEGKFLQEITGVSAADALVVYAAVVPVGKIWTILSGMYYPDVSETKYVWAGIYSRASTEFPITLPQSITLSSVRPLPFVTEGMEIKLFAGERLLARRDSATAGSSMIVIFRIIETDLPLYDYVEPQEALRIQKFRRSIVPGGVSPIGGGRPTIGGGGPGSIPHGGVPKSK